MESRQKIDELAAAIKRGDFDPIERMRDDAVIKISSQYFDFKLSGVISFTASAAAFAFLGIPGALLVGAIAGEQIVKRWQKGKAAVREINSGNLIPYLPDEQLPLYQQLVASQQRSNPLPGATTPTPPVEGASSAASNDAVEVFDSPQGMGANAAGENVGSTINTPDESYSPANTLARRVQCAMISGVPGTGKGILVSNAAIAAKQHHPKLHLMGIDPKDDPKERGYWQQYDKVFHKRIDTISPDECAEWLDDALNHWNLLPSPKLLVCDESTLLFSKLEEVEKQYTLKRFRSLIIGMCSSGDSRGEHCWLVATNPHTEDIKMSGGKRSQLLPVAIVSDQNLAALNSLLRTSFVTGTEDDVRSAIRLSAVKRAIYDGRLGKWLPMPKMENYSSWDRDTQSVIHIPVKAPKIPSRAAEIAPNDLADKLLNWLKNSASRYAIDGFISGDVILEKFRYKLDGDTKRLNRDEAKQLINLLYKKELIQFERGRGIKCVSFQDELGIFESDQEG